ncbi:MAG: hypothetical protein HXY35_07245 [Chloroflexi bacterium]|nr:hypothetical protein [Chloroflexota bacterium]
MNDVRKMIFGAIIGLFVFVGLMIAIVYVSSCGLTLTCNQAEPKVDRTPIPTLILASHSESQMGDEITEFNKCKVNAVDLIGAWVAAGTPETGPFPFTDVNGESCQGTYAEIQPLFVENSLWKPGALGCTSCHNADLTDRSKGLDLSSYDAVLLGSRRVAGSTSKGNDLLGNGDWEESVLYGVLVNQGLVPEGHSADAPADVLILFAGEKVVVEATSTPAQ